MLRKRGIKRPWRVQFPGVGREGEYCSDSLVRGVPPFLQTLTCTLYQPEMCYFSIPIFRAALYW